MKAYALGLLILTDLAIYFSQGVNVNANSLSFLLTLIVVVLIAFAASALLRNAHTLKMTKNYLYSGIVGVVVGIFFYFWIKSNTEALINWFGQNGVLLLLGINVFCALYIFFGKSKKKVKPAAETV